MSKLVRPKHVKHYPAGKGSKWVPHSKPRFDAGYDNINWNSKEKKNENRK